MALKGIFVTDGKLDELSWSGTSMRLYQELSKRYDLTVLEQVIPNWYDVATKLRNHVPGAMRLPADRTLPWRRHCAKEVAETCRRGGADFVFAPGSLSVALVDVEVPLFCYIDGTVQAISHLYGGWEDADISKADKLERDALNRCATVFCASQWCAKSVRDDYGVSPDAISVVGIGANNEVPISSLESIINRRTSSIDNGIRLLFVGVDWSRKGGDIALETVRQLHASGLSVTLDVVGCSPCVPNDLSGLVRVHGFLSKKVPEQRTYLEELYRSSHFFILPTQAECVGSVFCEASSAALPVLTCNVGGVTDVVRDGISGVLCNSPADFVDAVAQYIADPTVYRALQESAYSYYCSSLKWTVVCKAITNVMSISPFL